MKKVVLKVEVYDDRIKKKAMKAVSGLSGVESVSMDMKEKKMTLTGDIDPVNVVAKLRKFCSAEILSVGPAKEEKKPEPKKPDEKKDSTKESNNNVIDPQKLYEAYPHYYYQMRPPQYNNQYDYSRSVEEDPNGCVIV